MVKKSRKSSKARNKNAAAVRNARKALIDRLYPGCQSLVTDLSAAHSKKKKEGRVKRLRTATDRDPAELDHLEWLNYVSSAQHLQAVAQLVEKKVSMSQNHAEQANNASSPYEALDTEAVKAKKEEEAEERRQYLISAKKSKKYVASTLFNGRYSQQPTCAARNTGKAIH